MLDSSYTSAFAAVAEQILVGGGDLHGLPTSAPEDAVAGAMCKLAGIAPTIDGRAYVLVARFKQPGRRGQVKRYVLGFWRGSVRLHADVLPGSVFRTAGYDGDTFIGGHDLDRALVTMSGVEAVAVEVDSRPMQVIGARGGPLQVERWTRRARPAKDPRRAAAALRAFDAKVPTRLKGK